MFRDLRRSKQLLTKEATVSVLQRCSNGVLACLGDDDYPYAVPLSYAYVNDKIYFHSAKQGHKLDAIRKHPKVSFCVIDEDAIVSKEYTSYFRSVIVFGKARFVEGEEKQTALQAIVEKYSGDQPLEAKQKEVSGCTQALLVAIDIEHLSGKEAIELVQGRTP
jgi:hypothetical protein